MLMLTSTTDSLSVTTSNGAAYDVDVVSTFIDRVTSTGAIGAAQRELENITSATTVDIVEEPASDTTRKIKYVNIRNAHATSAVDVVVQIDANGGLWELHKATLLAGESLCYMEKIGFFKVVDTTRLERIFIKSADQAISDVTPTFTDITGFTCPMKGGVMYGVFCAIMHTTSGTTIAPQYGFNINDAPTSALFSTISTVSASATDAAVASGATGTRDTAISARTSSVTSELLTLISGYIIPSADGTFAMRGCVDQTGTQNVLAGSWLRIFRPTG